MVSEVRDFQDRSILEDDLRNSIWRDWGKLIWVSEGVQLQYVAAEICEDSIQNSGAEMAFYIGPKGKGAWVLYPTWY